MKFKGIKYERINIKLSRNLADKLNQRALNELISKSELIRNWINEDLTLHLKNSLETSKDSTAFNFRIDIPTLKNLQKVCKLYEISKSSYLRLLIINKLSPIESREEIIPNNILLKDNNYYETKRYLENKSGDLSSSELAKLINVNARLGFFDDSLDLYEEYKHRKNRMFIDESTQLDIELSKVRINLWRKDQVNIAINLEELNKRALLLQDRKILGLVNFLKGELYRTASHFKESIDFFDNSLEYFDVINHAQEIIDVYGRMAVYYKYKLNYALEDHFLSKTKVLLNKTGNKFQYAQYRNIKSMSLSFKDVPKAIDLTNKSLNINKSINFEMGQLFDLENLTRYFINQRDYSHAYKLIEQAQNQLKYGDIVFDFVQIDLCKIFIESFSNYNDSINKIITLKKSNIKNLRLLSCDYVLNSIKYINAKSLQEKYFAEIYLKRIMNDTSHPLFQKAAQYTLENKNLYLYF